MDATAYTFLALRRVHGRLVDWLHEVLERAGVPEAQVYPRFMPDDHATPHLVVLPYQVQPFPKMMENDEIPLMAAPADWKYSVPEAWLRLGGHIGETITELFSVKEANPRPRPGKLMSELPAPLAAWYATRPVDAKGQEWTLESPGGLLARAPSLGWRRQLPLEARYLVFASNHLLPVAPGETTSVMFGLPALGAIFVGLQQERTLSVMLPPHELDPMLVSFVEALAQCVSPERAAELRQGVAWASSEQRHRMSLVPQQEVTAEGLSHIVRAHNRPPTMVNLFAVHFLAGGGAVFAPSSTVNIKPHAPPPRDR